MKELNLGCHNGIHSKKHGFWIMVVEIKFLKSLGSVWAAKSRNDHVDEGLWA